MGSFGGKWNSFNFVTPEKASDPVKAVNKGIKAVPFLGEVAGPVLAHRLVLREGMEFSVDKDELLQQIVRDMEVPPWK